MRWPTTLLRIWPTFRCTRSCGYCAVNEHGPRPEYDELPDGEWIKFLDGVEGVDHVIVSGGEPGLRGGLMTDMDVVTAERGIKMGIYSNCSMEMATAAARMAPRDSLYFDFSYHIGENVEDYAVRFNEVHATGHRRLTVYTIILPEQKYVRAAYADALRFHELTGVRMGFKPLDGMYDAFDDVFWVSDHALKNQVFGESVQRVKCHRGEALVAPDGDIYRCHHYMYTKSKNGIIGNIVGEQHVPLLHEYICPDSVQCNSCDVGMRVIDGQAEKLDA